jgi:inositol transport system substrate-binding protein
MKHLSLRLTAVVAAAAAALTMTSCSSDSKDHAGGYRVAYIARAQSDSFAAWLANEMKAEAGKYQDVKLDVFDGQASDDVENTQIENAVANQYDAIIVQANNNDAQLPYIQKSVDAGIVTVTTNPKVDGVNGASSIDANPYDQGAVVAKVALDRVPKNAQVVVLNGPPGNFHSTNRRNAWKAEFFDKRPDVTILEENTANWNKDEALKLMEDWSLAHPHIDAVISMNDNMASGALEAVKGRAGFTGIQAYGVDGTPEATMLIQQGVMTATALQNAQELAKLNMKAVHDLLTGAEKNVDLKVGNPLITKDDAQQYIDLYKGAGLIK